MRNDYGVGSIFVFGHFSLLQGKRVLSIILSCNKALLVVIRIAEKVLSVSRKTGLFFFVFPTTLDT